MPFRRAALVRNPFLSLRRQRRKPALRRIENHGRSHVGSKFPAISPKLVVVSHALKLVSVHARQLFFRILRRFFGSEEFVLRSRPLRRSLKGSQRRTIPDALNVWLAVRSFWRSKLLRRIRLGLPREWKQCQREQCQRSA